MTLHFGLDVGTQGTKGICIDADGGAIVARAAVAYGLIEGLPDGAAEQHPATWIDAVREVARRLVGAVDADRVASVGVSGQQHGLVALDAGGEPVRPAKLWCDTTTAAEARELTAATGRAIPTGFTAPKVLWMARHEPDAWRRVRSVMLPHDYVNLRLTGRHVTEAGDASGTGWLSVTTRAYDPTALAALPDGLGSMLPEVLPAGAPAGELTAAGAALLGLREGVLVAAGGGDNMMSAIGSGATRPGVFVASLGTSGTAFAFSPRPVLDAEGHVAAFCDSTGAWLPLLCVMNMTGVAEEVARAFGQGHGALTEAAAALPAGADGLRLLPYLVGERTPDLPDATGTLTGIRPGRLDAAHLYRAALEGTSLSLAMGIDRMAALGVRPERLRVVGGGAHNPLWCQVLADAVGAPVARLAEPESAALGAAIQGLWTLRRVTDRAADVDAVARPFVALDGEPIEPDPGRVAVYRDMRAELRATCRALHGKSP